MSTFQRAYCMAIRPRGTLALDPIKRDLPSLQRDLKGVVMLPSGPSFPIGADSASLGPEAALSLRLCVHELAEPHPDAPLIVHKQIANRRTELARTLIWH